MTDYKTAQEQLKAAREFVGGNTSIEYLLVHKRESGPQVRSLEFRRPVQQEFEMLVSDVLTTFIDSLRDKSTKVRALSAISTATDESNIQHAKIEDLPDTELVRALSRDRDYPTTKYDKDDKPDFQLIKATDGTKTFIGVQNHQSLKTYGATDNGIPLLYTNTVYSKFDGDLLIVPESLNAVYFDGDVFVMTPKSFEKMFEMRDEYEEQAKEVIEEFHSSGIRFADERIPRKWLMGDIRILRKLYAVYDNEIPKFATPDNIQEVIDKYDVAVQYQRKNGHIELDIEQYTDIWKLLKVLNSDYAEAELIPDARLEIDGKRIIQN